MSSPIFTLRTAACAGALGVALFSAVLLSRGADTAPIKDAELWRHRIVGKAYFEDPDLREKSVDELKKALDLAPNSVRDRVNYGLALLRNFKAEEAVEQLELAKKQDPKLPHIWFNLGVAYRRLNRYPQAIDNFKQMIRLVPDEPVSHYALGFLYMLTEDNDHALAEFSEASRIDPRLVAPHFQLFNAYRRAGRDQDAQRELAVFRTMKKAQSDAGDSEDMEWSFYAELYDPIEARVPPPPSGAPAALAFESGNLAGAFGTSPAGLATFDYNNDGRMDLIAWSADAVRLYQTGAQWIDKVGLDDLKGVIAIAPGDFDNDGETDLCVLTASGPRLLVNRKGHFEPGPKLPESVAGKRFTRALWIDYDHDTDLDLILLGPSPALLRNQGPAGFTDQTASFPFAAGTPVDAVAFRVIPDTKGFDFAVSYQDHPGVLYRDQLRGQYTAVALEAMPAGAFSLESVDYDNDSWIDLAFADPKSGVTVLRNRDGKFTAAQRIDDVGAFTFADLEGRGFSDLVASRGALANQNLQTNSSKFATPWKLPAAQAWAAAEFDGDGRVDLAVMGADGTARLLRNRTKTANHWIQIKLDGVKNIKLAPRGEVEIKTGSHYQKKTYDGAPLWFGVGATSTVDSVRITWPNGMIQSATDQPVDRIYAYKEAPRMSGSCPMIFTWNGRRFQFVTDVLGVAPLGASSGDGNYFPVDHDEYVTIPGRMFEPRNGNFEVRITEELHEVSYLDQVRLIAVDHPAGVEILTNEKFKAPPFPDFRLFGVERRLYPRKAVDHHGANVLPRLLARDHAYPDNFRRNHAGVAELHTLDLDFGRDAARSGSAILVLNGWVDWADGSTFLNAAQERPGGLVMPYLQVKDRDGNWKTVVDDMGIPAGKPKTMVVDLTGKFLSDSREVRIVTDLCVYWDEIYLSEQSGAPRVRMTPVDASVADLHFRGFSTPTIHPERKQPETFDYTRLTSSAPWNPTPGRYTRYGDARGLVAAIDDRLAILGSGDELSLSFPARDLPPLPDGWSRDFLLLVDGWAKDADANTAFSQTVEPLPFHGMSRYPYPPSERFPDDAVHQAWQREFNTRKGMGIVNAFIRARR